MYTEKKIFTKIAENAGILASGGIISSILGLISFALVARSLDPYLFGVLALVQAYAVIFDKLINFQSWQALIKYGSNDIVENKTLHFMELIYFGFIIDFVTALIAFLIAFFSAQLIGDILKWEESKIMMTSLFSIVILFNIEGAPTAILRIYNRFSIFAYKDVISSVLRLFLVSIGFLMGYEIWYFFFVLLITQIFSSLYLLAASINVLLKKMGGISFKLNVNSILEIPKRYKGILGFIFTTNLHGSVRLLTLNVDVILVDSIFSSRETGLYQVVKQFSLVFTKLSQPLYKAIYPELTRLKASNNSASFKQIVKKFTLGAVIISTILWVSIYYYQFDIIKLTVGSSYVESISTMNWYLLGVALSVSMFAITPASLALGYASISLKSLVIGTVIYYVTLVVTVTNFGLVSFGISYFTLYLAWAAAMFYYYKKEIQFDSLFKS